jgi:hypothetical protein
VVLKKRSQLLGEDHVAALWIMDNLARTYYKLGQFLQAEGLWLCVDGQQKKLLGDDHPHTIISN